MFDLWLILLIVFSIGVALGGLAVGWWYRRWDQEVAPTIEGLAELVRGQAKTLYAHDRSIEAFRRAILDLQRRTPPQPPLPLESGK